MEDKTFQLLEKMYSEFIQFKEETNKRFDGMDNKINDINKTVINIEQDHGQKLNALFDGYKQNAEAINKINQKIDKLTDRVENQEIKLQVLKSAK